MNDLPKVVFSNSLDEVGWENARLNEMPVEEEIPRRLKAESGRDIIACGFARFAHGLIAHRLIDEYRLTVNPFASVAALS